MANAVRRNAAVVPIHPGLRLFLRTPEGHGVTDAELADLLFVDAATTRAHNDVSGDTLRSMAEACGIWGSMLKTVRSALPGTLQANREAFEKRRALEG
jgi:hypothetical protein